MGPEARALGSWIIGRAGFLSNRHCKVVCQTPLSIFLDHLSKSHSYVVIKMQGCGLGIDQKKQRQGGRERGPKKVGLPVFPGEEKLPVPGWGI